jgi:hypothetical protein
MVILGCDLLPVLQLFGNFQFLHGKGFLKMEHDLKCFVQLLHWQLILKSWAFIFSTSMIYQILTSFYKFKIMSEYIDEGLLQAVIRF